MVHTWDIIAERLLWERYTKRVRYSVLPFIP